MQTGPNSSTPVRRCRGTGAALVLVVFGLLLWAKLLLVTNHPRTAVADPAEKEVPATADSASQGATAAVETEAP